ncbi:16S rRNA processing protein RimM [Methylobacillus rhizosphaerae]|uniref:Ribosome maturation factor RimM n=1 Tax=Methylobacillus rhizosphaerae TaxID=551994 RepID=A0A238XUW7_9PROT|nr:ribosome maturation factor RimM [Methylobacillus rhizosphaerae]SNR62805.1 16S rRNA processing protein RimM [Methylobacillus rhizosphaerae]
MGRIVAPYGVYGWIKVLPDTEYIDSLFEYGRWILGRGDPTCPEQWRPYEVEKAKVHNDLLLVKLKGIDDRDAAFACKGMQVAVYRDELPEPEDGEYYWSDLIGLQVRNQEGVDLGRVVDVFATGANDVIVLQGDRERLLPFVGQVVLEVDIASKTMLVDWDAEF